MKNTFRCTECGLEANIFMSLDCNSKKCDDCFSYKEFLAQYYGTIEKAKRDLMT